MTTDSAQKFSLPVLTAMVVGSMVGAGIFSLPQTFGRVTGVYGGLLAWVIAGVGMLMLALVFQTLAQRKPDLDAGVYAYAKAGFGNYWGFLSALGYWAGSCIGNVSYFVLIKSTLGAFFPIFGDGNTIQAVAVSHIVPTVGLVLSDGERTVGFSSDTSATATSHHESYPGTPRFGSTGT